MTFLVFLDFTIDSFDQVCLGTYAKESGLNSTTDLLGSVFLLCSLFSLAIGSGRDLCIITAAYANHFE